MSAHAMALAIVLCAAPPSDSPHPLDHKVAFLGGSGVVYVVDVAHKAIERIEIPGLKPLDVDLHPDGRILAFTAIAPGFAWPQLFLMDLPGGLPRRVGGEGYHQKPRFSGCGLHLDFALAPNGVGGVHNPTQLFRLDLADSTILPLTADTRCHFAPASAGPDFVAGIETDCSHKAQLVLVKSAPDSEKRGTSTQPRNASVEHVELDKVSSADTEVASSPNGKLVLYTKHMPAGIGVFVVDRSGRKKPKYLGTWTTDRGTLQPSFHDDTHVALMNRGHVYSVNALSGSSHDVMELNQGTKPGLQQ